MEMANDLNDKRVINKWIFFTFNYPSDFIEKCWSDDPYLAEHIRYKFEYYSCNINRLYCEIDNENKNRLLDWVLENYNSERKVFG